jgi:hypothetical protein
MNAKAIDATAHWMDHRWGCRSPVQASAEIWNAEGDNHQAVICNASLSGALLQTRAHFASLSQIALRILPHGDWLEAWVIRVDDAGTAVEWLDPGLRALDALVAAGHRRPSTEIPG